MMVDFEIYSQLTLVCKLSVLIVHSLACTKDTHGILKLRQGSLSYLMERKCSLFGSTTNLTFYCIQNTTLEESFDNFDTANGILRQREISALIGRFSETFALASEYNRVPYFVTSMVPQQWAESPFLVRILPGISMYGLAIKDILQYFNWKEIGIIYDNAEGAHVLAQLLDGETDSVKAYNIRENTSNENVRIALKGLRDNFYEIFIILCSSKNADIVLTQALYLSLLSRPNKWLVVNMGVDDVALDKYLDSRANLTSVGLMLDQNDQFCALSSSMLTPSNAVFHDSVKLYQIILDKNKNSNRVTQMRKTLKEISTDGCTGHMEFTKFGMRKETFFQMSTLATTKNGSSTLFQSGTWRSGKDKMNERIEPSKSYNKVMRMNDDIFGNKALRVTTLIEPPFIQWKNDTARNESLDLLLEGFCVSVLEEMARILNFKYNISIVPDKKFGSKKPWGWTGMVNVLMQKDADIALAPFQITPERSEVVDFTKPFMTKGTSVIVRKPERSVSPFQFLSPLSKFVWIAIFLSFLTTSMVLFITSRVNCDRKPKYMHNLKESLWYIWGTILRANLTTSPQGISSRVVSCAWWFFSLIIISIYTANLAAFLTISNAHIAIDSAADLAYQDIYDYGTVEGSQIENFFKHTKISHYAKMWAYMGTLSPDSLVKRVENGFQRVKQENYAFLWDSPTARHQIANDCDLMEIGSPFDLKGYGIATQKNSPYTEKLSWATLKLNDDGVLYRLEGKWWRRPNCPDPRQSAKSKAIEINVASGMFIVLLSGIVLSVIVFLVEMAYSKYKKNSNRSLEEREENNTHNTNMSSNHVGHSAEGNKDDGAVRTVLSRTLSIGDNCVHHRWETDQL